MDEVEALVVLVNLAPTEPEKLRRLVEEFGSANAALRATSTALSRLPGFGKQLCGTITRWEQEFSWRYDLELIEKRGVELISYWDARYPDSLRGINDPPVLLYVWGALSPADNRSFCMVGTRQHSSYGGEFGEKISQELASLGFSIVSSLSPGIDTIVHRAALKGGRSVAVSPVGIETLQAGESAALAAEIARYGAVISEWPMTHNPGRELLPRRHRLMSGLSIGAILVESPLKGQAMNTMKQAWLQERKLFSIPGRLDAETFKGNHLLIKQKRAQLIECGRDAYDACKSRFELAERRAPPSQLPLSEGAAPITLADPA